MCGRFTQSYTWAEICAYYRLINPQAPNIRPHYNVAPSEEIGVIVPEEKGLVYRPMRWGLIPSWAKEPGGYATFNARAETVETKPAFRAAFRSRRCLIPASGFFEWRRENGKQPYYITAPEGALLTFAGLWERWVPKETQGAAEAILSSTIIVTDASPFMKRLHERMPVILPREAFDAWLSGEAGADILKPYEGRLRAWPVSKAVGNPRFEGPDCIAPLGPSLDAPE